MAMIKPCHSFKTGKLLFHTISFVWVLFGFLTPVKSQQVTYEFTNYSMGSNSNTAAFTTNNFTAAGVGRDDRIWVGSQYGGLYTLDDDGTELWFKSTQLTNVFINQISSDADGGIWIAQSGTQSSGGNSNLGGALNYFPTQYAVDMKLYTIPGTVNDANLFSRNVRSVYVNPSYPASTGKLPRVWIGQGTYITNFTTRRGGINFGMNAQNPLTIRNVQGFTLASGTPICESVDGNDTEIWAGLRQNQGRSQILRYKFNGDLIGEYSHLNTTALPAGFFPNAIHFDDFDFKWIGLREGGIRILTPANEWITVNMPTIFPPGTQINHNAITSDDLGNVYVGTSNGLIIFKSQKYFGTHPANADGYIRITTTEGLVDNNVRGMAFDKKNKRLIIATAGGISFMKTRPDNIVGTVFNAFTGLDGTTRQGSGLLTTSPPQGFTVKLLYGDNVEDEKTITGSSIYELSPDFKDEQKTYKIEIVYKRKNGKNLTYTLNGIKDESFVPSILVPDSLLGELDSLKPKMENQCFDLSLIFGIKIKQICLSGFNISGYDLAGSRFRDSDDLTDEETLQLNNLANYMATLHAANKMGGIAKELETEGYVNALEFIQFAIEEVKFTHALKEFVPEDKNPIFQSGLGADVDKLLASRLKLLKEGANQTLKFAISKFSGSAETKKDMESALSILNEALDILINLVESGMRRSVFETLNGNFKKILSQAFAEKSHQFNYLESRHANLVPLTSNNSRNKRSPLDFQVVFNNVNNPGTESLVGVAQAKLTGDKSIIEKLVLFGNTVGVGVDLADAGSKLALVPGGQAAGLIFKGLAIGAKVVKATSILTGSVIGLVGAKEIRDSSEKIRFMAGFESEGGGGQPAGLNTMANANLSHGVLSTTDSVTVRATRLNQQLTQLNVFYQSGTWQPIPFGNSFKAWLNADSLLSVAMSEAFLQMAPYLDDALKNIAGFETFYQVTIDTFLEKKIQNNHALFYRTLAWMHFDNQATEASGLDSLVKELTALHDSLSNRIAILTSMIENSDVVAGAYLEKTNWSYNHNYEPGSSGSINFTFKNIGPVAMQNVRFILQPLTGEFILNSPDSVFGGTIAPGQSIQYSFNFTAPQHDSLGRYQLLIISDNGRVPEVSGPLMVVNLNKVFSVQDGNWNNPNTWHNGVVPLSINDVQVGHNVTANIDVNCKTLFVTPDGNLQVLPGKKVTILQ